MEFPALPFHEGMEPTRTFTLPAGLCGPPDCANGGIIAGMMARPLVGPVEVTLQRPVPLEEPIMLERIGSGTVLRHGHEVLALARQHIAPPEPPPSPSWADALEASGLRAAPESHPFPACFVCGPARSPCEALCLPIGPLRNGSGVAAPWIVSPALAANSEILWAALDCPGGFAALVGRRPRPIVLGRILADIRGAPEPGEACVVHGWPIASEGRKHVVGTSVHGFDGRCIGVARATWLDI
jgi:hypothetical protein